MHAINYPPKPFLKPKVKGIALVLSIFVTGAGQIYNEQKGKGIAMLIGSIILLWFQDLLGVPWQSLYVSFFSEFMIMLNIALKVWSIVDAHTVAEKRNRDAKIKYNAYIREKKRKIGSQIEEIEEERENYVNTNQLVESLKKYGNLFSNKILSHDEFKTKKSELLQVLNRKKIRGEIEDFFVSLIALHQKKLLSAEDITSIKMMAVDTKR